jgi:hypothetical protein
MTTEEMLTTAAVQSWKLVIGRFDGSVASLSDEQLQTQVAPGRNRLLYLVGHLTAVHDRMFPLLGLGERLHPELDEIYLSNPDQALPDSISASAIKQAWREVNRSSPLHLEHSRPSSGWRNTLRFPRKTSRKIPPAIAWPFSSAGRITPHSTPGKPH